MTDGNSFDAELNALMNGEVPASPTAPTPATPASSGTPSPANPTPTSKVWKAGGREWTDPAELAKSHDAIVREFGKRNQDWNDLKELREVRQRLNSDPEFNRYFKSALDAFQNSRAPGNPNRPQNQTGMQLPAEVAQQMQRVTEMANSFELERETQALVRKYKLDESDVRKVEDYSLANQGIPLEQAYKQLMFDANQEKLAKAREQDAARKKEASKVGPVPGSYQPSPRGPSMKSDADWRSVAGKELEKFYNNE
jgi:hypothetical protein